MSRPLSEDEHWLVDQISRFGADAYPINKLGKVWTWGPIQSINGPPTVFKTRREAVASFEAFHRVLLDALADARKEAWELRGHWLREINRWHYEKSVHLREHEDAAKGRFPTNTMICDHVGGQTCQYIDRQIETAQAELVKLTEVAS